MRIGIWFKSFTLAFIICGGCASRATTAQEIAPKSVEQEAAAKESVAPSKQRGAVVRGEARVEKPVPIIPGPRTPIVGGCNMDCIKPDLASRNFFLALLESPRDLKEVSSKKNEETLPVPGFFLDSRELSYKGGKQGETWQKMWAAGERSERQKSVEQFCRELRAEILGVNTGVTVEALVEANLKPTSSRPGEARYIFVAPGMPDPLEATFHKRGVEWLLYRLEVHQ